MLKFVSRMLEPVALMAHYLGEGFLPSEASATRS